MPWPPSSDQIQAVSKHLAAGFPGVQVDVKPEDADWTYHFRLAQKSEIKHELVLARVLFEDHPPKEIMSILTEHGVVGAMRQAGSVPVRVTKYGSEVLVSRQEKPTKGKT
jgi:hypothetical protein